MTDQEINEAVARKLGWTQQPHNVRAGPITQAWFWHSPGDNVKGYGVVPDFCHDIKAAWLIVEFLGAGAFQMHSPNDGGFFVRLGKMFPGTIGTDQSAPMAICLAFLKLPVS